MIAGKPLLLMATIALLAPSAVADLDLAREEVMAQNLSAGLAVLLIVEPRKKAPAFCDPDRRIDDCLGRKSMSFAILDRQNIAR